ncbi:hypothetical protein AZE42_12830, partial [Rhizopogon vesiculosus]
MAGKCVTQSFWSG